MPATTIGIAVRIPVTTPSADTWTGSDFVPKGTDPARSPGAVYIEAPGVIFRVGADVPSEPPKPATQVGPETVEAGKASGAAEAALPKPPVTEDPDPAPHRHPVMLPPRDDEHGVRARIPTKRAPRRRKAGNDPAKATSARYQYRQKDYPGQAETIYRQGAPEPAPPPRRRPATVRTVKR